MAKKRVAVKVRGHSSTPVVDDELEREGEIEDADEVENDDLAGDLDDEADEDPEEEDLEDSDPEGEESEDLAEEDPDDDAEPEPWEQVIEWQGQTDQRLNRIEDLLKPRRARVPKRKPAPKSQKQRRQEQRRRRLTIGQ